MGGLSGLAGGGSSGGGHTAPAALIERDPDCAFSFMATGPFSQLSGFGDTDTYYINQWFDLKARAVATPLTASNNAAFTSRVYLTEKNQNSQQAGKVIPFKFDGAAGQQVTSEGRTSLDGASAWTVILIIRPDTVASNHTPLALSVNGSDTTRRLEWTIKDDGSIDHYLNTGSKTYTGNSGVGTIKANEVQVIAATVNIGEVYGSDAGRMRFYLDGEQIAEATGILTSSGAAALPTADPNKMYIGCALDFAQRFDGAVYALVGFRRELTLVEITKITQAVDERIGFRAMQFLDRGDSNVQGGNWVTGYQGVWDPDILPNRTMTEFGYARGWGVSTVQNSGIYGASMFHTLNSKEVRRSYLTSNALVTGTTPNYSGGTKFYTHALQYVPEPLRHYVPYYAGNVSNLYKTFGTSAVNTSTGALTITSHGFTTRDYAQLQVQSGGGNALPTGWAQATWYHLYCPDADTIYLMTNDTDAAAGTLANAAIPSTTGTGTAHTIGRTEFTVHTSSGAGSAGTGALTLGLDGSGAYVRGNVSGGDLVNPDNVTIQPSMIQKMALTIGRNDSNTGRDALWVYRMLSTYIKDWQTYSTPWIVCAFTQVPIVTAPEQAINATLNDYIVENSAEADAAHRLAISAEYDADIMEPDEAHLNKSGLALSAIERAPIILATKRKTFSFPFTGTNCKMWLDFTDLDTITLDGSNIVKVNDKSGNGCHVVNYMDNHYAVHDGDGAYFQGSAFLKLCTPALDKIVLGAAGIHIIAVLESAIPGTPADRFILEAKRWASTSSPRFSYYLYTPSGSLSRPTVVAQHTNDTVSTGFEVDNSADIVVPDNTLTCIEAVMDLNTGDDCEFYRDDAATATRTTSSGSTGLMDWRPCSQITIGNNLPDGDGTKPLNGTLRHLAVFETQSRVTDAGAYFAGLIS